jgi:transposase-like protein
MTRWTQFVAMSAAQLTGRVRYSMKFIPWKDYREVAADLKRIYKSATEEEALLELANVEAKWTGR